MRTRTILLWWALFAVVGAVVVLFLLPLSRDVSEPVVAQVGATVTGHGSRHLPAAFRGLNGIP